MSHFRNLYAIKNAYIYYMYISITCTYLLNITLGNKILTIKATVQVHK